MLPSSNSESQLRDARDRLETATQAVYELAAGGTAVGTGINAPPGFGEDIAAKLAELTGLPLKTAPNKFAAQGSLDGMVAVSAGLRGVAVALMKIANDMRWLASGPRAGDHADDVRARRAGDPQAEKHEVPRHERREHLPEPEEADRIDRS